MDCISRSVSLRRRPGFLDKPSDEGGLWLFLLFSFRRERNSETSARRAAFSDSNASTLASKTMTKSFNTDMSFDNSMNQMYSLKQTYIELGCMPKFLHQYLCP